MNNSFISSCLGCLLLLVLLLLYLAFPPLIIPIILIVAIYIYFASRPNPRETAEHKAHRGPSILREVPPSTSPQPPEALPASNHYIKTKPSISSDPMLDFQHATTAERQRPLRKYTLISILLVLIAGSVGCSSIHDGPQQTNNTPVLHTLPSPTPTATPIPRRVSGHIAISNIATPTPVSGAVAVSNIPFPTPTPTATPDPFVTPTATPVPKPSPTPTATRVPISPEDEARAEAFYENFISISYEASFDMPNEFTESDYPVTATVNGWVTTRTDDNATQFFTKIDMTKPVQRSIEVVSRPATFDMYLHDLDANKWYFLPENSSALDIPMIWNSGVATIGRG